MADAVFDHRALAMQILTSGAELRRKEGQFLGSIAFNADPLTEKQANWLSALESRYLGEAQNGMR